MTEYDPKEFEKKKSQSPVPKWVFFIASWLKAILSIMIFVALVLFLLFAIKWLWLQLF